MISKRHWSQFILVPLLALFGLGFLIFGLFMIHDKREIPFGVFIMFATFSSVAIALVAFFIVNLKTIKISENEITINFLVKKKVHKYHLEQITGFNERFDRDRFGEYKTFNFSTDDNNIFMFSSKEYKNYNDLAIKISTLCSPSEISFYQNALPLLKYFIVTFLSVSLLLYVAKII